MMSWRVFHPAPIQQSIYCFNCGFYTIKGIFNLFLPLFFWAFIFRSCLTYRQCQWDGSGKYSGWVRVVNECLSAHYISTLGPCCLAPLLPVSLAEFHRRGQWSVTASALSASNRHWLFSLPQWPSTMAAMISDERQKTTDSLALSASNQPEKMKWQMPIRLNKLNGQKPLISCWRTAPTNLITMINRPIIPLNIVSLKVNEMWSIKTSQQALKSIFRLSLTMPGSRLEVADRSFTFELQLWNVSKKQIKWWVEGDSGWVFVLMQQAI